MIKYKILFTLLGLSIMVMAKAQNTVPTAEEQIKTAIKAAPEDKRDGAMVYGYNDKKELVVLRKGTNEMVCLADNPEIAGINVSCYHKDLDSFMTRGRALKKEGKGHKEIFDIREKEVKSGKLAMPKQPSALFVYSASDSGSEGKLRYVVYIPYATSESTGLPLGPEAPGMPWIMDAGTHGAHIMINP